MSTIEATCYRIIIPRWHPYEMNRSRGRHWSAEYRLKKIDRNLLAVYGRELPRARGPRSVRLVITLGPRQRGCDGDAYFKGLLDNLVALGHLVDDGRKWCRLEPVEYVRGTEKSTTIELRDL